MGLQHLVSYQHFQNGSFAGHAHIAGNRHVDGLDFWCGLYRRRSGGFHEREFDFHLPTGQLFEAALASVTKNEGLTGFDKLLHKASHG